MNLPNFLTLCRVVFTFLAVILISTPMHWCATVGFVVFTIAAATDFFDGYIARKCGVVTTFGKFMDALSDKVMVVAMFMTLFALGLYKNWVYLALALAVFSVTREFFVSGVRMLAAKEGVVLAAESMGKYKAALQMYSVGAILFAHALSTDFNLANYFLYDLGFYSGIIAFVISTILSVWSGISYGTRYSHLFMK